MRTFATGATRDTSVEKLDPYGFISPAVMYRFSEYMHKHRTQSDGSLRDSDNWKKGMPIMEYVRSLIRHTMDFWMAMSGTAPQYDKKVTDPEEIACAIIFNAQGFLHEVLKRKVDSGFSHGIALERDSMSKVNVMVDKNTRAWS